MQEDTIKSDERGVKHDLHLAYFFNIINEHKTNPSASGDSLSVEDSLDLIPRIAQVTRQLVKSASKNRPDIAINSKSLP